ncbi:N-terminal acetyltransferase A auxiliary subunit [Trinorchestia longiramus]|nr:N-terminal acetyltransferase A auxiliary subunit [Trinorchestia longiramus]
MSPAELKKYRARQRKNRKAEERKQEEKRKEEKKAEQKKKQAGQDDLENPPQEELIPHKLERPADPINEALYFLRPLQALLPRRLHTHLLAFSIHLRRNKPLLMLQCLKRAWSVDRDHPELHTSIVQFLKYCKDSLPRKYQPPVVAVAEPTTPAPVPSNEQQGSNKPNQTNNHHQSNKQNKNSRDNKNNRDKNQRKNNHHHNHHHNNVASNNTENKTESNASKENLPPVKPTVNLEEEEANFDAQEAVVVDIIHQELISMVGTVDPLKLNEDFLNKNNDSLPHRLQAARSMVFLDEVQKQRAIEIATEIGDHIKGRDLETLKTVLAWLDDLECQASTEEILRFKSQSKKLFPRAQIFMTEPPQGHTTTVTTTTADSAAALTTTTAMGGTIASIASPISDDTESEVTVNCKQGDEVISNHVNHVNA